MADHRLLADDQVAAGVELEERVRACVSQETLDDEAGDGGPASVADRHTVGVDAAAEHRHVFQVDARFRRDDLANGEQRSVARIRERAVSRGGE